MAEDWAVDVKKYAPDADDSIIAGIVRYCGIALTKRDSSLVSMSDPKETGRVRENFLKKKLGLTLSDADLDAAIQKVGETMKADRTKNRVTVYYLLASAYGKLELFRKAAKAAPAAKAKAPAAKAPAKAAKAAPAAALGLAAVGAAAAKPAKAAATGATAALGAAGAAVAGTAAAAATGAGNLADKATGAVGAAGAAVAGGAAAALSGAGDLAGKAADTVGAAGAAVAGGAAAAVAGAGDLAGKAADAVGDVASGAVDTVGNAGAAVAGAAGAALAGAAGLAGSAGSAVSGAASGLLGGSDDGEKKGGLGWLLWLLLGLLALFLLWWLFFKPQPLPEGVETANVPAATEAAAPAESTAPAPAEGTVAIPTGAGVTTETRDGKPVVKVYFDSGKAEVVPAFAAAAGGLKAYLDSHAGSSLTVSGFNDPTGNAAFNAELSKNRAQAVQAELVKVGIPEASAVLTPPASATDATGNNAGARRVEVTVK